MEDRTHVARRGWGRDSRGPAWMGTGLTWPCVDGDGLTWKGFAWKTLLPIVVAVLTFQALGSSAETAHICGQ
jgi:hypothetical protein